MKRREILQIVNGKMEEITTYGEDHDFQQLFDTCGKKCEQAWRRKIASVGPENVDKKENAKKVAIDVLEDVLKQLAGVVSSLSVEELQTVDSIKRKREEAFKIYSRIAAKNPLSDELMEFMGENSIKTAGEVAEEAKKGGATVDVDDFVRIYFMVVVLNIMSSWMEQTYILREQKKVMAEGDTTVMFKMGLKGEAVIKKSDDPVFRKMIADGLKEIGHEKNEPLKRDISKLYFLARREAQEYPGAWVNTKRALSAGKEHEDELVLLKSVCFCVACKQKPRDKYTFIASWITGETIQKDALLGLEEINRQFRDKAVGLWYQNSLLLKIKSGSDQSGFGG